MEDKQTVVFIQVVSLHLHRLFKNARVKQNADYKGELNNK